MIRSLVRSFSCEEQSLQRVQQESHVLVITSLLPDNLLVVSVFPPDIIHSRLTEKGIQGNRGTCTCHEIQVLSGQGAYTHLHWKVTMEHKSSNPVASQAPHPTNHTGSEFQQLFLGLLDPLWVSFNSDQVALLIIRGNAHRHLVEVLNPVNCKARAVVTHSARPRLGSKDTLTRGCLRSTSASEERPEGWS